MDLRRLPSPDDLLILLTVARLGRFNAVAETLGTTHTTISRRILALDRQLGGRTLERSPHGWELTDLGNEAVAAAEAIEGTLGALTNRIAQSEDVLSGLVRISTPDGFGAGFVAPALVRLQRATPVAQRRNAQRHPQGQPEPVRRGPRGGGGQPGCQQCADHLPVQLFPPALCEPGVRPGPRAAGDARRRPAARLCLVRGVGAAGRRTGPPFHPAARPAVQLPGHQHLCPAGGRPAWCRDRPAAQLPGGGRPRRSCPCCRTTSSASSPFGRWRGRSPCVRRQCRPCWRRSGPRFPRARMS